MGALREPLAGLSRGWAGLIARLKPATFSTCRNPENVSGVSAESAFSGGGEGP